MAQSALLCTLILLAASCARGPEGSNRGECDDQLDNDGNGFVDCEDQACANDPACVERQAAVKRAEAEAREARRVAEEAEARRAAVAAQLPFIDLGGLAVQKEHNGADIDQASAERYCEQLTLADRTDWRLPTRDEAVAIARSGRIRPEPFVMWTSTAVDARRAIIVGITSGAANDLGRRYDGDARARCVAP